ncbi:fatty acid metabolism transcriptional regulator FadR [Desulfatiferula olefinivorans]
MKSEKYHIILDAAIKVFAEHGFFQSTVAQIARKAGVADGTIYLYFENKEDILLQFFAYKTRQIFDQFQMEVDKSDNAESKLRNLVTSHLKEFQGNMDMAIVFQAETRQVQQSEAIKVHIRDITRKYRELVGEIIEEGQNEGIMRKDLYIGLVKTFITGAVEEVINSWVLANGKYDLVSMADPLVDLYLRGIGNH